ncbi:glycerol-3-phosphate 1-O-acyltransferase PlsY [Roseospirillum parvum]|uniref:Glycerol-3-phosphate acyltransferase n=1 Tax=Roseospirillum parvum TaxID=83401 RepID=A0A1G7VBJ2_9PROT|nr:glycerol-3-phosphate 1-O-acyltransferase PlsY [Roseospirillum parvum]SDG57176.1 glycerol-3-phosphate acyltransferase PlsY [Roseospirillum parvum]
MDAHDNLFALAALMAQGGYVLGAIPFGLVLCFLAGAGDIRKIGSGNIGATNVLRTGRKGLALATLILDSSKGAIAVLVAHMTVNHLGADSAGPVATVGPLIAGAAAVIGHNYSFILGFKGGKGVATTLGVLLATAWPVGVAACLTWLVVAGVFRMSSLSALTALGLAPAFALLLADPLHAGVYLALALMAFYRHLDNIGRLVRGEEPRMGAKKAA